MTKRIKLLLVLLIGALMFSPKIVNADEGPKPSITIKLENMNTKNYSLELLEYTEKGSFVKPDLMFTTKLDDYTYLFSYFGTPETYKVVLTNLDTQEIKHSKIIKRNEFTSIVTLDAQTMEVINKKDKSLLMDGLKTLFIMHVIVTLVTVLVETIIALFMKIKIKPIILTNIASNILLQLILIGFDSLTNFSYLYIFIPAEIIIFILEYLVYKKYIKNVSNKKLIIYVILANMITALLTFIDFAILNSGINI